MSTNRDSIRIKRGMSAELPESLPLGELAFCIDTRELWVGSGEGLALKRVTNTEITQHLEEWNLLYTEVDERFETKYHDVTTQFQEKFLDLSEQFSDKYADLNKQFSDKFEEICVQFSTKYNKLEEHYAQDLHDNKLSIQQNRESIDLLKRDIGTTENIEDLREINNQATETLEQLNAVKEELQNDVLVIKDIEKDLQKASVDYSGEHHENLKDSMDANVDFILGEFNSTNMTGEHITAHNTIQRHIKNAELKGHTEVNYIKDPSDKDLVMPYPFDDAQSIKLSDTKDTGSLNIVLKGNTEVNVLKNPMRDYVVPYEFEEGYTATLTDTKETGSIQSAILKGQTLVNLLQNAYVSNGVMRNANVSYSKADTTYTLIYNVTALPTTTTRSTFMIDLSNGTKIYQSVSPTVKHKMGINKWVFKTPTDATFSIVGYWSNNEDIKLCANNIVLLEGDYTNVDIPYFEGMTSVKMPVLTTTGKNLFDINNVIQQDGLVVNGNSILITENRDYPDNIIYTFENAPTESVLSFDLSSNNVQNPGAALGSIWYEDGTKIWITVERTRYKNTKKITDIKIHNWCRGTHIFSNIQLEQGSATTTYEPYKTNILTVNEDVTLRGIGDVKDTLDCLTGDVTQRIGEVVLDGSIDETWHTITDSHSASSAYVEGYVTAYTYLDNFQVGTSTRLINDKGLPRLPYANTNSEGLFYLNAYIRRDALILRIDESKVNNSIREYLQANPITVQYQLATESVKTVDFTILDQDGLSVPALSTYNEVTYINTTVPENSLKPLISSKTPEFPVMIKPNTKYSIVADTTTNGFDEIPLTYNLGGAEVETSVGEKLTVIQTPSTLENETFKVTGTGMKLSNVMILEKDLTGKEIPNYTEGMQSVKMPVLTTTGKNLLNLSSFETGVEDGFEVAYLNNYTPSINYKENTQYIVRFNSKYRNGYATKVIITHTDGSTVESMFSTTSFTTTVLKSTIGKSVKSITFKQNINDNTNCYGVYVIQGTWIEESPTPTTYEPYKSNILTVNEDVTLRGIGDVRDTLDLMTGEVVERIGEIIIDENSNIAFPSYCENVDEGYFKFATDYIEQPENNNYISNKLQKINVYELTNAVGFTLVGGSGKHRYLFCIKSSELSELSLNGCKQWLAKNPITIQYQLATESIKTVDLNIINQNGQKVDKLSTFNEVTYVESSVAENSLKPIISHKDLEYEVLLKPNTKYSIITNPISNGHPNSPISFDLGGQQVETTVGSYCTVITTPQTLTHEKLIFSEGVGHKLQGGVMVLEGDKTGMTFSHFDGMKSVENPTVRVNNKNLFNPSTVRYSHGFDVNGEIMNNSNYVMSELLRVKPGCRYYVNDAMPVVCGYDLNSNQVALIRNVSFSGEFTTPTNCHYIRIRNWNLCPNQTEQESIVSQAYLAEVGDSTGFIPHQSNSLPLTIPMRSLPNGVCDTLNLLTGEYVQNIEEYDLRAYNNSGNSFWTHHAIKGNFYEAYTSQFGQNNHSGAYCDKIHTFGLTGARLVWAWFPLDELETQDANGVAKWVDARKPKIQIRLKKPIVTKLDLQWEDGKLFAYDGTTHFFVDVEGGHLQPILDVDVPVNIVAELSRLRAEKEQLETSKAQLENQLEVITYRNTNLQSNLDSLVAENQDLKLQTYDLQTRSNVLQLKNKEMTKHQEKLQAENLELQKRASELAQTTMNLTEELHVVDSVRETGDLELLSSDFELDFRLMEIEFALDIPISLSVKGVSSMARTPFEMAKTLILGGKYDREDMEKKLKVYQDRGKITSAEYDELVALMDANELA